MSYRWEGGVVEEADLVSVVEGIQGKVVEVRDNLKMLQSWKTIQDDNCKRGHNWKNGTVVAPVDIYPSSLGLNCPYDGRRSDTHGAMPRMLAIFKQIKNGWNR